MSAPPIGTLDLRGVPAPVYLLHARRAIVQMGSGETIEILTEPDQRRVPEVKALAEHAGFILLEQSPTDDALRHVLRRR